MDSANNNLSPYARLIQHGLAQSNRKLLEFDAALGRTLIFGRLDGSFEEVSAADFLKEVRESDWWKYHFESNSFADEEQIRQIPK